MLLLLAASVAFAFALLFLGPFAEEEAAFLLLFRDRGCLLPPVPVPAPFLGTALALVGFFLPLAAGVLRRPLRTEQ